MPLIDYVPKDSENDMFEPEKNGLKFPCRTCEYRLCDWLEEPCSTCSHNIFIAEGKEQ